MEIVELRSDVGRFREASWAVSHSELYQGEPEEGEQGEHCSNQAWKEQERKREFWWLQKKDSVRLNWSAWSSGKQADRVCSPLPLVQAGCQKWHRGYELHWKNGMPLWPTYSEEGRSIPGVEPIRRISVLTFVVIELKFILNYRDFHF